MTQGFVPTREREVDDAPLSGRHVEAPPAPVAGRPAKPHEHTPTCGECGDVLEDFILMGADGRPAPRGWRKIGDRFREEMPTKSRAGRGGKSFSYLTARQVAKRLDDVVGPGNWSTDWECLRVDHPVAARVGVSVFGVWKWDAGYSNNPEADEEADKSFELEPLKAAVSDGFKRAAAQWGIGRWIYGDT